MKVLIALGGKKGKFLSPVLVFPKFLVIFFLCLVANSSVQLYVLFDVSREEKSSNPSATIFQV